MSQLICPCCGQKAMPRQTPITEFEAQRAYELMRAKGITRAEMLGKHAATLDAIAPGMLYWIRAQPDDITPRPSARPH